MVRVKNFRKEKFNEEKAEESSDHELHPDFNRNLEDSQKLIDFWSPKLTGHSSRLRFFKGKDSLYLTLDALIDGRQHTYSSPHPYDQPWANFRGSVTFVMRKCGVLGERDDSQASGEWRRTHGVKVTKTRNSYHELFDP